MRLKLCLFTKCAAVVAVFVYLFAYFAEIDTFALLLWLIHKIEQAHMQSLIIPIAIVILGVCLDCWRARRQQALKMQQMKVLSGFLINVDHLFRNLLNTLYFFKDAMQEAKDFPEETISLFDKVIDETTAELTKFNELDNIPEVMSNRDSESKKGL